MDPQCRARQRNVEARRDQSCALRRSFETDGHPQQRRGETEAKMDRPRREKCSQCVYLNDDTDDNDVWMSPGHLHHPRSRHDEATQGLYPKQESPQLPMTWSEKGLRNYDWRPCLGLENTWNHSSGWTSSEKKMSPYILDSPAMGVTDEPLSGLPLSEDCFPNQMSCLRPVIQPYDFPGNGGSQFSTCEPLGSDFQGSSTGNLMGHSGEIPNPDLSATSNSASPLSSTSPEWPEHPTIRSHLVPTRQFPYEAYGLKVDTGVCTNEMAREMPDLDLSYQLSPFAATSNGEWCQAGSSCQNFCSSPPLSTTLPSSCSPEASFATSDLIAANDTCYQYPQTESDSMQGLARTWMPSEPFDSLYQPALSPGGDVNASKKQASRKMAVKSPTNHNKCKDTFLVRCKLSGMSYKEIKEKGQFVEAESTLRGRFRTLTKRKEHRVRKPGWRDSDLKLLCEGVARYTDLARRTGVEETKIPKVSWKHVGEYIWNNGGSYHFGNATCKKKWEELRERWKI